MSRIRSDSIWNRLEPERRRLFEHWLFEERVSYKEALARAKKEWGVTASKMSVSRYCRRREEERPANNFAELLETSRVVDGSTMRVEDLKRSAMKVTAMRLLETAVHRGEVKDLAALSRVLGQYEEREIERGRMELSWEKGQFHAEQEARKRVAGESEVSKKGPE
jgi:hypothetical protein